MQTTIPLSGQRIVSNATPIDVEVDDLPFDPSSGLDDEASLASEEDMTFLDEQSKPIRRKKQPSIVELIETVKQLQDISRPLTLEERDLIANWPGWGPYAPAFEKEPREKWEAIGPQIRMLLGTAGYEAASAATPTSFFTAPYISKAIWRLAEKLGFSGGQVLEAGCGTGQVLSYAPAHLDLQMTGIEQEPFTASIAQLLFPHAHIITAPLQEVALANDHYDLAVGNVPFADIPIYDRTLPFKEKLTLHNYFIYRALAALRPGGLAILVTTYYTMDAATAQARQKLSELGLLLGAIRLPSMGHRWAKTSVITDILVLQRRVGDEHGWKGHVEWLGVEEMSLGDNQKIKTNAYYASSPEQIVGTPSLGRGMYRDNELIIKAPDDLENALDGAIGRIVLEAARKKSTYIPRLNPGHLDTQLASLREDGLKEGCFYLMGDVGLVEIVHGQPQAVTRSVAELSALVRVRESALVLMEAERDYAKTDEELRPLRLELNRRYDTYVKHSGPIRQSKLSKRIDQKTGEEKITRRLPSWMYTFRTDEHYPLLLGLEIYDDETGRAKKATIFSERVNHPAVYKETAESPEEAIALSLDRYGSLDFAFIASATGRSEETVAEYLGDLVYEDPAEQRFEIAPTYLSGNVRHKLEVAGKALRSDPKWQRNVDALQKIQPEPIAPDDIKVLLGAPWVPVPHLIQFCQETIKLKPEIVHDRLTGKWTVSAPAGTGSSVEATSTWGTARMSAFKLIEHLLNRKTTTVEDVDSDGKAHANTDETMLAQQKRKELQTRFSEWIWEDLERTNALAALYNTLYNGVVPSSFNGDHLSFPGMDPFWQTHLYSWQRDFIARMINTRSGLCAYPVGAGKTKIQVAGALTLRRMGLINRAAILVPNHLLEQITAEAKQLYPAANILMISHHDLSRENRRIFMARIATGDHDLVIMTHGAFEAIDVHPATKRAYIQQRIKEYKQVLLSIGSHGENKAEKRRIKQIEKQLLRMREQLEEQLDTPHDSGITFEQLGISYLVVDEAHFFKNLGLPTNQEKLQVTASQRAQDMLMKLRWLEQQNGKRPFASFFTATPISNSMVEAYVMLWYLKYDLLKDYELFNVDDFASMFIETEAKIEVTPNGAGFRMYERPTNFINLPEFMHLFATVADIRSPDILADKRPDRREHTVAVEPTPEVIDFVNGLVARSEELRAGSPREINGKSDNMLWVTTDGRKAALSMLLHGIVEAYPAKLDAIASEMAKVYDRWQEKAAYLPGPYKSLQIGFCDLGTPNPVKGDQVYGQIKRLLVEKGVPAQGIRFIHEAGDSDAAKAALFEKCRTGEVAILLGSTAKLGTGTNIQTRCAAIHHCDAPWRPDEVEQREGRGQRPGNLYPVVEVFYYVQRRTFDAYSWQILANKAKFFNQMRSTTAPSREMAYSDDSSLTYGQVKAAATGDILLLEHANVTLSADAFSRLHASFERARQRDQQEARQLRTEALHAETALKRYQQIVQQMTSSTQTHPFMTVDRLVIEKKEARRKAIAHEVVQGTKKSTPFHKLGYWQGIPLFLKCNFLSAVQYSLAIADPTTGFDIQFYAAWLDEKNQWNIGATIEDFFKSLPIRIEAEQERIVKRRQKAEEFEAQARTVFPQHDPWQTVLARKQALDHYINCAANAHSEEARQHLVVMRQHLMETAPKEMMERPTPKNTATYVLPPRNPMAEAAVSTTRIEVEQTQAKEQTIEEIVRTIQQSGVVGSRAAVSFGNYEHIQQAKKRKKGKSVSAPQVQSQPKAEVKEKQPMKGEITPTQAQPKAGTTKKKTTQYQGAALWDLVTQESAPLHVASASGNSELPEQLTLF
jgi:N12 class adenine-specific DNA methylase/SAM-dependent methyltransferase